MQQATSLDFPLNYINVSANPRVDVSVQLRVSDVSVQPRADYISDSTIVPDDYQNLLIYYRDQMTEAYFGIGDVANRLAERTASTGFSITEQRVYEAVGRFCGKSARTVRYYAETCRFYPEEARTAYDMLPFSHFVFARALGSAWKGVLDYSMLNPGATIESLRQKFLPRPGDVSDGSRADVSDGSRVDVSTGARELDEELEKIFGDLPNFDELKSADLEYASGVAQKTQDYVAITKLSDFVSGLNAVTRLINSLPEGLIDKTSILADIERVRKHIARIAVAIMPSQRPS
jgi:hypothetical protein